MRSVFFIALIATIIGSTSYWYQTTSAICPVPIAYRIGVYDDRFALTPDEVRSVAGEAEAAWEQATGRELLRYDPKAAFTIDFVFDERQQRALTEEKLRGALDQKELANNETLKAINDLNADYDSQKQRYEERVRVYDKRLREYNERVESTNSTGGASPEEFAKLTSEKTLLATEVKKIDAAGKSLNALVATINETSERGNQLIDEYNRSVGTYNDKFSEAGAFTQGEYTGNSITVYKYTSRDELLKVMTHEFGHALGLDHVEDPEAIMYYLLEDQPVSLTLAAADTNELTRVCGTGKEVSAQIRSLIRSVLP